MAEQNASKMIDISDSPNIWTRFFMVHTLVIIGSKETGGSYNLAPKHMAMPLGFGNHFGFMGTPRKTTYQNVLREKVFTVSYPRPEQLVFSSLAASRREEDDSKPVIDLIPTVRAQKIDCEFLENAYLQLECKFSETLGKFDEWELVVGKIIAAYVHSDALRNEGEDRNDARHIRRAPLLAYLHPDRFSVIKKSTKFPLPKDFKR